MKSLSSESAPLLFSNRYLFSLALPLMADTALSVAVGVADTMMVAQAGEAAVSGVSCLGSVQNLFIFLIMAFATGGCVVSSQLLGMGDEDRARRSVKMLFYISFLTALILSALFLVFRVSLVSLIFGKVEKDVFDAIVSYALPIMISMPAYAIISSGNAVLRTEGRSKVTMMVSILVNIVNISGNALCIFVFHMGAFGVGLSSCVSRYVGAFVMLAIIIAKNHKLYIDEPLKFEFDKNASALILNHSIPITIEKSLFHVGKILISSTISTFGTASIAAFAVFSNMETVIDIPGNAFGLAAMTIIGQCCGARRYKEARFWAGRIILYSYLLMWLTSSFSFFAIPEIIKLYSLSPESVAIGVKVIRFDCINRAIAWPLAFVLPNILHGTGDAKMIMVTSVLDMWICRVLLANLLGVNFGLGLLGTQMGMWADWYVRIAVFLPRFLSGKWEAKGIAAKEDNS